MQMNFLQLVQRAYRESGLTGNSPASVLNQSGRNLDVVDWVLQAHEEIQTARPDWSFDWAQGSFALTPGTDTYNPVTAFSIVGGVRQFARNGSYSYVASQGVAGRLFMEYMEWEMFRHLVVPPVNGSQPVRFCLRPDGDVQYYPIPTAAVTVVHEYWRNPQTLAADTDTPRMPAWSHMAIAWKAVMLGCGKTKDWSRFDSAEENYEKLYERMLRECTPQMVTGGPLA